MQVYIAGVAMTPFTSRAQGLVEMTEQVTRDVLADSGVPAARIGMVFVANAAAGLLQGQEMIRGEVLLQGTELAGLPVINVENACASASTAVHLAAAAVAAGQVDAAIAIGVEQMAHPDRRRTFGALASATDTLRRPDMFALVDACALRGGDDDCELTASPLTASPLMEHYAQQGAKFLAQAGGGAEDLALVVAKNRFNGSLNPNAQLRRPVTVQQVLQDRMVAAPLTRSMCSPVSTGAAAILIASENLGRRVGAAPVRIRGTGIATFDPRSPAMPSQVAAERAYAAAGVGPDDIDVAELHDAAAPAELILMEAVGLCDVGRSIELLRSGATALGGTLPVNPGGGLIARGHPLGATGCAQLVELAQQLRGQSGQRQVESARFALAQNSGGVLGDGEAVGVVTILEKAGSWCAG